MFFDDDWRDEAKREQFLDYESWNQPVPDDDEDEYDRETEVELEHYWRE